LSIEKGRGWAKKEAAQNAEQTEQERKGKDIVDL
jgi:hypothetical protein